jgi:hypothetical protein
MGGAQSVPGSHSVSVTIATSYQSPRINGTYSETLRGYMNEIEWHYLVDRLSSVTIAAGSAEASPRRTCCFFASIALLVIGFMTTGLMTPIACALDGWGFWCKAGAAAGVVAVASLITLVVLAVSGAAAGQRWTAAAIQAVDAQLLPDLRARHPLMIFELRDLQKQSFEIHIERVPEGRNSLGQVVVPGMAVAAEVPVMVASAPMPEALAKSQDEKGGGGGGGDGLAASLLHG